MLLCILLTLALIAGAAEAGKSAKKPEPKTAPESRTAIAPPLPESTEPPAKMVWVDHQTKAFYRRGHPHYGQGRQGEFMEVDAAIKAGYREAGGGRKPAPQRR